jgi:hypothetical protein
MMDIIENMHKATFCNIGKQNFDLIDNSEKIYDGRDDQAAAIKPHHVYMVGFTATVFDQLQYQFYTTFMADGFVQLVRQLNRLRLRLSKNSNPNYVVRLIYLRNLISYDPSTLEGSEYMGLTQRLKAQFASQESSDVFVFGITSESHLFLTNFKVDDLVYAMLLGLKEVEKMGKKPLTPLIACLKHPASSLFDNLSNQKSKHLNKFLQSQTEQGSHRGT